MSIEAITNKIARIREYVAVLKSLQPDCVTRMKRDKIYRGAVLYHLYLMADSCVAPAAKLLGYPRYSGGKRDHTGRLCLRLRSRGRLQELPGVRL